MTVFAQVPAPTSAELGGWFVCLAAVLGIIWISRQIWVSFHPPPAALPSHQDSYVTQAEFAEFKADVRADITRLDTDIRAQLTAGKAETTALLVQHRNEMTANLTRLETDLKGQLTNNKAETATQIRDLHAYTRDSFHRQANAANNMLVEVTRLTTLLEHGGGEGRRHPAAQPGDEDEDARGQ